MSDAEYKILDPKTLDSDLDLIIMDNQDNILDVDTIKVSDGVITEVETSDSTYSRDEIKLIKHILTIPGVGHLTEGARVVYKEEDYILRYGWHTNISNQTICSWYLRYKGNKDCHDKTLYKEMINDIEVVHFR